MTEHNTPKTPTIIRIKHMVCDRCISKVTHIIEEEGGKIGTIDLGYVALNGLQDEQLDRISVKLKGEGFEILSDPSEVLTNKIRSTLLNIIHQADLVQPDRTLSVLLSDQLGRSYSYLSRTFKAVEGKSIEQYAIELKIEKAKELLTYGEHNISEISAILNYSSPQHLSRQFKKITGQTPTAYINSKSRKKLDTI